jgi:hypothetical protein
MSAPTSRRTERSGAPGDVPSPGATGNLATEDLAWVFEREGRGTGAGGGEL